jgi:nucleotide-binding universal stress UspA family protein
MSYQRIVLGYEESPTSKHTLERAGQMAKALGAELIVTSVAPVMINIGRSAGPGDPADPPSAHVEELEHARSYLEGEGIQADYVQAMGHPARTIVELAKEREADLIVLGSHEPGVLARLFGQSVTETVAHKVHCDVLIVHPGD